MDAIKNINNENGDIVSFLRTKIEDKLGKRDFIKFFASTFILIKDDFAIHFIFKNEQIASIAFSNLFKEVNVLVSSIWSKIDINISFMYKSPESGEMITVSSESIDSDKINNVETIAQNTYIFDEFLEDETNKSTSLAIKSISCFNPDELISTGSICFIHGEEGVGKTHLLRSAESYYNSHGGSSIYIRGSDFLRTYVSHVQGNDINNFFNKMNSHDIFMLDNLEYFIGKNGTINALVKIVNDYVDQNKYVILSSRMNIGDMLRKEPKLKDILNMAIGLEIKSPSLSLKKRIINREIVAKNLQIPMQITDLLVNCSVGGIKGLKFNLNKINLYHKIHGVELNNYLVSDFLNNGNDASQIQLSTDDIINAVSKYHNIESGFILSKLKMSKICQARQECMYFIHNINNLSYSEIGNTFKRNHSTVISSIEKIKNNLASDSKYPGYIAELRDYILKNKKNS